MMRRKNSCSQARVGGQSKTEDIRLEPVPAELEPTPHTSSHGSTSFPAEGKTTLDGESKNHAGLQSVTVESTSLLAEEETTSDGESKSHAGLQSIMVERNGTNDGLLCSSSSATLPKICGCLSLKCFNKCRGTQSDSDDRDSVDRDSVEESATRMDFDLNGMQNEIRNGTNDGLLCSSSSATLPKICGCLSLKCFNKCRGTQSDSDDRDSVDRDSVEESATRMDFDLNGMQNEMHLKLRKAVSECDLDEVKQLLAGGVSLSHLHDGQTALHNCIEMYGWCSLDEDTEDNHIRMKIVIEILAVTVRTKAVDIPNEAGETPLYLATAAGSLKLVETIVKAGARMENISNDGSTVLHVAARSPCGTLVLKYYLDNHKIPLSFDKSGLTPVHHAVKQGNFPGLVLLLGKMKEQEKHELLTSVDKDGLTLVHLSADIGDVEMTMFLLRNGAVLSVEGERIPVIHAIDARFVDQLEFLHSLFDKFVTMTKGNRFDVKYKVLASKRNQIKVLEDLVKYGYRRILKHPLVESLIYVKWKCLQPVFGTIVISYSAFLVLFNIFIITTFIKNDDKKNITYPENNGTLRTEAENIDKTLFVESYGWYPIIYIAIFILLAQECMWLYLQRRRYFKRFESYVTISALVLAAAVPLAVSFAPPAPARHVVCAALLLVWLRPLFILSRIFGWGHYVLMLKIVAINLSKIFAMLGCLVIGFAICFMIQYQLEPPFNNIGDAMIKTLVMMSSEFDFEDLFADPHAVSDADSFTAVIVRLLFVVFVILIATVMMNLMIGVAVSDTTDLAAIGNIMALEMQVELLSSLEGVENLIIWKWSRRLSRMQHHDFIHNNVSSDKDWFVSSCHKKCYKVTLDSKLHHDIYEKARKNSEKEETQSKTLEDRIQSLEANNENVMEANKEIIEGNKEIGAAIKDIEKSNNDLKKDVNKILELATSVLKLTHNRKVVPKKLKSRKIKMMLVDKLWAHNH